MRNIIIDFHESDTWKIQLIIAINISSKDGEEEHVMHSKTNNAKFTSYNDDGNEVIDELFKSLSSRYQGNSETSMEGSEFIFDSVQLMYY